jgi:heme-degrading monooxygenase HmoA
MPYMLIRHKVKDYAIWKPVYDEHNATRKDAGSKGARIFRKASDPDEIIILFEWDSLDNAKKFAKSEDLKKRMQEAGVSDQPDIYFLEQIEQSSA